MADMPHPASALAPSTPATLAGNLVLVGSEDIGRTRERLRVDGYIRIRGLVDAETLFALQGLVEELPILPGPIQQIEYDSGGRPVPNRTEAFADYHKELDRFVRDGPIAGLISSILGEPALLYKEKVNYKAPFGSGGYPPHQDIYDARALGLDPKAQDTSHLADAERFYVCMLALDASTAENGCPSVAPRWHVHGSLKHTFAPLRFAADAPLVPAEDEWVAVPMGPGDVLIYDQYMPHKSGANASAQWRRALFAVYNAASKGELRKEYYEKGRTAKKDGGTGRWAAVVPNTTGVGAPTITTGIDGTGRAVYERPADAFRVPRKEESKL